MRETLEEAGVPSKILKPLGEAVYRSKQKKILAFLAEPLEPPTSAALKPASWEVDRVEFLTEAEARERIHPDQAVFLDRAAYTIK